MGNVESVSDFFWPENYFLQKLSQQASQLNGALSISAEVIDFPSWV